MEVFVPVYLGQQGVDLVRPVSGKAVCVGYIKNVALARDGEGGYKLYITNNPCHKVVGVVVDVDAVVHDVAPVYPELVTLFCKYSNLYVPRIPIHIAPSVPVYTYVINDDVIRELIKKLQDYEIDVDDDFVSHARQLLYTRVATV